MKSGNGGVCHDESAIVQGSVYVGMRMSGSLQKRSTRVAPRNNEYFVPEREILFSLSGIFFCASCETELFCPPTGRIMKRRTEETEYD